MSMTTLDVFQAKIIEILSEALNEDDMVGIRYNSDPVSDGADIEVDMADGSCFNISILPLVEIS